MRLFHVLPFLMALSVLADAGRAAADREVEGAAKSSAQPQIVIRGRAEALVTTREVQLSDIADVQSPLVSDDAAVLALKKISIGESPRPGETHTIAADTVIARMRAQGVNLDSVRYVFPRELKVVRAARIPLESEIRAVLESYLESNDREARVSSVRVPESARVPLGDVTYQLLPAGSVRSGVHQFGITALQEGREAVRFSIDAQLEEWRDVPVVTRQIPRGSLLESRDVTMARMRTSDIPPDSAKDTASVIGLEVTRDLASGVVIRKAALSVPPIVESGKKITLLYRTRFLEASAEAVALDAGAEGDTVRVRNEVSKRVMNGRIIGPGLVEVSQ